MHVIWVRWVGSEKAMSGLLAHEEVEKRDLVAQVLHLVRRLKNIVKPARAPAYKLCPACVCAISHSISIVDRL